MVSTGSDINFRSVIEEFFALKKFTGPHAELLRGMVRERADALLAHPDIRYMPAFKILDLLAALVNIASAVADAPQLRVDEARILIREALSDTAPLVTQFLLEAALERARYEPMMVSSPANNIAPERNFLLQQRWKAMRRAHQEKTELPERWIDTVEAAMFTVIHAAEFQDYRQGPLLQYFDEMLASARKLHAQGAPLSALSEALRPKGALWKRYALKNARYQQKDSFNARLADFTNLSHPSRTVH